MFCDVIIALIGLASLFLDKCVLKEFWFDILYPKVLSLHSNL